MGAGCSEPVYLFLNKIFMENRASKNGWFFHPFCDDYEYPCVQCCLELLND